MSILRCRGQDRQEEGINSVEVELVFKSRACLRREKKIINDGLPQIGHEFEPQFIISSSEILRVYHNYSIHYMTVHIAAAEEAEILLIQIFIYK